MALVPPAALFNRDLIASEVQCSTFAFADVLPELLTGSADESVAHIFRLRGDSHAWR